MAGLQILRVGADRCALPRLTDMFWATKCCCFTAYPLSAFTKTTGMTTNIHRVLGSRNRGNAPFCPMSDWLTPPVVYASGLHQTRRSANATSAESDVLIQILVWQMFDTGRRRSLPLQGLSR